MVGVAVIFEEDGAAREGDDFAGAFEVLGDGPGTGSDDGGGDGMFGEAGRRSRTSDTDGDGPSSAGMRVASTGELVGSEDLEMVGDLGAGGRMDGRRGFGRRTGGVSCCGSSQSD